MHPGAMNCDELRDRRHLYRSVGRRGRYCVALAAVFLVVSCASETGTFSISNRAGEPIVRAVVEVCGQAIELDHIPTGSMAAGSYEVRGDSHVVVDVTFRSGRRLRKADGYVTNGMSFHHDIVVTDSSVAVVGSETE